MQTFLPYPDFARSSEVLDDRRLGKQRVETFQILRALTWPQYAWKNHPAVRMWRGFVPALVAYGLANCDAWVARGYGDTVRAQLLEFTGGVEPELLALGAAGQLPLWLGDPAFHRSHQSSLVRKDPAHYRGEFPDVPDDLPYVWPADLFPRWPVTGRCLPLDAALQQLGYASARAGQAEAAEAVVAGRDVLFAAAPRHGGTAAGLLAGLMSPGPVVVVVPGRGDRARHADPPVGSLGHFAFFPADQVPDVEPALIVVDGADRVTATLDRPAPVLAVTGAAGPQERAAVIERLRLRDPLVVGGGFDRPRVALRARVVASERARRAAVAALLPAGPGLVLTASRRRAEQVAAALERLGVRAEAAAPGMRASRLAATLGRYRRLGALVVPAAEPVDLGRAPVRFVVWADLPADLDALHRSLELVRGEGLAAVVALADEVATAEPRLRDYLTATGCRRAVLLDAYGEVLDRPCGRCDGCRSAAAEVVAHSPAH